MLDEPPLRCLGCGYDLRGLPENRCPECGREFDPADCMTYFGADTARAKTLTWRLLSSVAGLAALCSFVLTGDRIMEREPVALLVFWGAAVACWTPAYFAGQLVKLHPTREPAFVVLIQVLHWLLVTATALAAIPALLGSRLR